MARWSFGGVHHLGLTVVDIERSIDFYINTLGMTLLGRRESIKESYIDKQTGYDGVELNAASFQPEGSATSFEVVQYMSHQCVPLHPAPPLPDTAPPRPHPLTPTPPFTTPPAETYS